MTVFVLFLSFFLLMIIGVPIALSLGFSSLITMVIATNSSLNVIIQKAFASLDTLSLLSNPFFIWVCLLILSFFLLMIIGVPIALSLGFSSLITMVIATNSSPNVIIQKAFASLDNFSLMAIPFFILAGVLMSYGGISKRLLHLATVLIGF